MVGGWTRSASDSSRGVMAPASSRLASTESWFWVSSPTGRVWRSRRLSRVMAMRSSSASCAAVTRLLTTAIRSVTVISLTNEHG